MAHPAADQAARSDRPGRESLRSAEHDMLVGAPFHDADEAIRAALKEASVPALLMSMVHMTGDMTILSQCPRPSFLMVNDLQGGMSEEQMADVRARAFDVIVDYRDRGCPAPFQPDSGQLQQMLRALTGQPVGEEYLDYVAADLNLTGADLDRPESVGDQARRQAFPVVVIGCGESGLLAGIRLKQAGIPFTIIEKQDGVGGTWRMNTYPGCRVDIANHYYSYSFAPNNDWSHFFSEQPEILHYLAEVMDRYDIGPNVRFNTEVLSAAWDDQASIWTIETRSHDGQRHTLAARALICSVGQFGQPVIPDIPGRKAFTGPAFHTSCYDHSVDLTGKRVAVIGAGASGFQLVPAIADRAAHVTVYQRTAQWMFPNPNYHAAIGDGQKWAIRHLPFYGRWLRFLLWWPLTDGATPAAIIDPEWDDGGSSVSELNALSRDFFLAWMDSQIDDPELIAMVKPDYPVLVKRTLQDDGTWLKTLQRDDVELVRDRIDHIDPGGVTTVDGLYREADILVWATGFDVNRQLGPLTILGVRGQNLNARWGDKPGAFLGITVPDFPNFFLMYGPGTNAVNGASLIYYSECQMRYIMGCLSMLIDGDLAAMEPRQDVFDDYIRRSRERLSQMVYSHPAVSSYYKNSSGEVPSIFPWRTVDYWHWTRRPNRDDYVFERNVGLS